MKHSDPKFVGGLRPLAEHFNILSETVEKEGFELGDSYVKEMKKRPLTSNVINQKRASIDL